MATYIDYDANPDDRTFVIDADEVTANVGGVSTPLVLNGAVANIAAVSSPFASLTAAADAHNALLAALKAGGVMVDDV